MTAVSAAGGYKVCLRFGVFKEAGLVDENAVESAIILIAITNQRFKPQSEEKKAVIIEHLQSLGHKSLIGYVCLCLKYEAGASGHPYTAWMTWVEVIDSVFTKRSIPPCIRYGHGNTNLQQFLMRSRTDLFF